MKCWTIIVYRSPGSVDILFLSLQLIEHLSVSCATPFPICVLSECLPSHVRRSVLLCCTLCVLAHDKQNVKDRSTTGWGSTLSCYLAKVKWLFWLSYVDATYQLSNIWTISLSRIRYFKNMKNSYDDFLFWPVFLHLSNHCRSFLYLHKGQHSKYHIKLSL